MNGEDDKKSMGIMYMLGLKGSKCGESDPRPEHVCPTGCHCVGDMADTWGCGAAVFLSSSKNLKSSILSELKLI